MQYMRIFQETSEHMRAQNRSILQFKSEPKQVEYFNKLAKQSSVLRGEMEYLSGERTFNHAT